MLSLVVSGLGVLVGEKVLSRNAAYSFFQQVDGLVVSGPSLTNVNDFRAILVEPA